MRRQDSKNKYDKIKESADRIAVERYYYLASEIDRLLLEELGYPPKERE